MYSKTYKGKYKIKNKEKYVGDPSNVVYRSMWERQAFKWVENNPNIVKWSSEEVVIPYKCATDGRMHRYFMDLYFMTKSGDEYIIEIKPKKETSPPKVPKRKTKRYIQEAMTYVKNDSKWRAASSFARARGWRFEIWHEDKLRKLGIKIL
jgi:hypothetical protein